MRPDLVSLALFVRAAELRSLTRAAEASHLALAAASRRIQQLEEQYGVQLLYRSARGVDLTPAGATLLQHARGLLQSADQMGADLSDYSRGMKGLVRVQANASALAQYLPHDLASFAAKHPAIKIALGEERSAAIVAALLSGHCDVGIVMEGAETEGLDVLAYRTDTLCAVVPKKHPVRARRIAFADLLEHDFVGLESNTVISQLMLAQAQRSEKPLRLRVQVKSFDVVAKMIQAGLGIGVLPEEAAAAFAPAMGLRLIALDDAWATRRMTVCIRHGGPLTAPARQLVDHLTTMGSDT